jgi:imidazolonepropionase
LNANELVTVKGSSEKPAIGKQMRHLGIISGGSLAIKNGTIVAIGKTSEVKKEFKAEGVISASGKTVIPGLVDPHTHLVFSGSREDEFQMRIEGASYMEILKAGGGILKTIKKTREASLERLVESGFKTLDVMLKHGTTTVEVKSGYGLTVEDELKILQAIRRLNQLHSVDVIPSFMGAHAVPPEYKNKSDKYVDLIIEKMIPQIAEKGLAQFCDVFCEKGVFDLAESRRVLHAAKEYKLRPKIHADEMSRLCGAELAAEIGAVSAEHLLFSSEDGLMAMAEQGVIAVLLPAAAFSLMTGQYADARKMINLGVPVALGTDFNPSCWVENQQLIIAFACHFMRLTAAEAMAAATINAAHAIDKADEIGSLELGKKADAVIMDVPNHKFLGYRFGINIVEKVVKDGRLVFDRDEQSARNPLFF